MVTRFGGNVPQKTGNNLVLIFLGFLVVVIILLAFVVFSGSQSAQPGQEIQVSEAIVVSPSENVSGSKKDILVAIQRIEEGAQFGAHMFQAMPWDIDTLPQGAVFPSEMEMIVGKFATKRIDPNTPLLKEYISEIQPINLVKIPPGYRAVTITVDSRSGVEGYARPNTRVDVLWTYIEAGKKQKVTTIVPFAKVLSVSGGGEGQPNSLVTLLVTIQQAKKIELARKLGELSLALIGEAATGLEEGQEIEVDITDLIPEKEETKIEEQHDGTMIVEDPKTGKKTRYVLVNGRWKTAEE